MPKTDGHFPGECLAQGAVSVLEGERIAHWEMDGAIYHVAVHLADSVPATQLAEWREIRQHYMSLRKSRNGELSDEEVAVLRRVYDEKVEKYLSSGYGSCALRTPGVAEAVAQILERRHGSDYDLHLLTIMPNHLHVIVSPATGLAMKDIVDRWKSITAHAITKASGMAAPIWQRDHYSRIIRTPEEYRRQDSYVWHNPESAGLQFGFLRKRY